MSEIEDYEKKYLIRLEREERHKKEFLRTIQELIDERDAEIKSQNQPELQPEGTVNINSEGNGKSRKEIFEEYEKKYLDWLEAESRKSAEMRKKADEIVVKRLSESQIEIVLKN